MKRSAMVEPALVDMIIEDVLSIQKEELRSAEHREKLHESIRGLGYERDKNYLFVYSPYIIGKYSIGGSCYDDGRYYNILSFFIQ